MLKRMEDDPRSTFLPPYEQNPHLHIRAVEVTTPFPRSSGPRIGVAVIDDLSLRRSSTLDFLRQRGREPAFPFDSATDLLTRGSAILHDLACVLLNVGGCSIDTAKNRGQIEQLHRALPDAALVVMSDREDIEEVVVAFRHGARGFIPTSFEPEVASEAIGIVLAGGTFFPASALLRVYRERLRLAVSGHKPEPRRDSEQWPPRQLAVLELLAQGKANKEIARELHVEESTVKVHVWHIMRRLKASNRTEAALRARQLGIFVHESGEEQDTVADEHSSVAVAPIRKAS